MRNCFGGKDLRYQVRGYGEDTKKKDPNVALQSASLHQRNRVKMTEGKHGSALQCFSHPGKTHSTCDLPSSRQFVCIKYFSSSGAPKKEGLHLPSSRQFVCINYFSSFRATQRRFAFCRPMTSRGAYPLNRLRAHQR